MPSAAKLKAFSASIASALAISMPTPSAAYEVITHGAITARAYVQSNFLVNSGQFLLIHRYGLDEVTRFTSSEPFGKRYYDVFGNVINEREANSPGFPPVNYEKDKFTATGFLDYFLTIPGWIIRGSIREDDLFALPSTPEAEKTPEDDRCTNNDSGCLRVINHFFDPYNNRAIEPSIGFIADFHIPTVRKAPDWAVGSTNSFAAQVAPETSRQNHFSIFDAREAMFRALTLRKTNPFGSGYVDIFSPGSGTDDDKVTVRLGYWATMFRAVGDAVHLVQDMAQPQHTRNDPHAGRTYDSKGFLGHRSFYEWYIEARATPDGQFAIPVGPPVAVDPLVFGSYPVPAFNRYSDYWSTNPGDGSLTGLGLADYSSRGFYSAGTNIGSRQGPRFPQPIQNTSALAFQTEPNPVDMAGNPLLDDATLTPIPIDFVVGTVTDTANPSETAPGVRLSTVGLFNQFLQPSVQAGTFNLNKYNYDEQARLLIPRAVAYSAGLINYFFRGSLKITLPPENVYAVADIRSTGFTKLKMQIKNDTPDVVTPDGTNIAQHTDATGTLIAVLRYRRNNCLQLPSLAGAPVIDTTQPNNYAWDESCRTKSPEQQPLPNIVVSDALPASGIDPGPQTKVFTFQTPLPFDATDVELQVVYRGTLGAETDAIAVGFEQISEPNFFNFDNYLDCFQDRQCPAGSTEPGCSFSGSVKLPFPEAAPAPGWTNVASVSNLKPGEFARVAFLAGSGWREEPPRTLEVAVNQYFPYEVDVRFPDGTTEVWPPGPTIRNPLARSRLLDNGQRMLEWWANGYFQSGCVDGVCGIFPWASTCTAPISAIPQPVQITFP